MIQRVSVLMQQAEYFRRCQDTLHTASTHRHLPILRTLSTLEGSHSNVSNIFLEQAAQYGSSPGEDKPVLPESLMTDHTYQRVYTRMKASICQKG
jgi:hypothetical protein